jgi:hypothetical protein
MSAVALVASLIALFVAVAKGILGKEIQGRIERRILRSVAATIASLPEALQAEYAEEWRAELAASMAMPLTAAAFARGLRRSAARLAGESARSRSAVTAGSSGRPSRAGSRDIEPWRSRSRARLAGRIGMVRNAGAAFLSAPAEKGFAVVLTLVSAGVAFALDGFAFAVFIAAISAGYLALLFAVYALNAARRRRR